MSELPDAVDELVEYEVLAAWHDGYAAALVELAERADALDTSWRPQQRPDPEQVIADRAATMIPVEGVEAWLAACAQRWVRHDEAAVEAGRRATPITTWAQLRACVSDRVWIRILDDLAPGSGGSRDTARAEAVTAERGRAA